MDKVQGRKEQASTGRERQEDRHRCLLKKLTSFSVQSTNTQQNHCSLCVACFVISVAVKIKTTEDIL